MPMTLCAGRATYIPRAMTLRRYRHMCFSRRLSRSATLSWSEQANTQNRTEFSRVRVVCITIYALSAIFVKCTYSMTIGTNKFALRDLCLYPIKACVGHQACNTTQLFYPTMVKVHSDRMKSALTICTRSLFDLVDVCVYLSSTYCLSRSFSLLITLIARSIYLDVVEVMLSLCLFLSFRILVRHISYVLARFNFTEPTLRIELRTHPYQGWMIPLTLYGRGLFVCTNPMTVGTDKVTLCYLIKDRLTRSCDQKP